MRRANEMPLKTDTILLAFDLEDQDELPARDSGLVWEMILIRVIERIPQDDQDALPVIDQVETKE